MTTFLQLSVPLLLTKKKQKTRPASEMKPSIVVILGETQMQL